MRILLPVNDESDHQKAEVRRLKSVGRTNEKSHDFLPTVYGLQSDLGMSWRSSRWQALTPVNGYEFAIRIPRRR